MDPIIKTNWLTSASQLYDLISLAVYDAVNVTAGKLVVSNPECRFWICFAAIIHFQLHLCLFSVEFDGSVLLSVHVIAGKRLCMYDIGAEQTTI